MFIKIKVDNVKGIDNEIELDFISSSRKKEINPSVAITDDNIYVNKLMGIAGSNGTGKSTIYEVISSVGSFLEREITKRNLERMLNAEKKEEEFPKKLSDDIVKYIKKIQNEIGLPEQNQGRLEDKSTILMQLYIKGNDEISTGYYSYELVYDKDVEDKGIIQEKLSFKKKYRSSKEKVLFDKSGTFVSQIGYDITYFNNMPDFERNKKSDNYINYLRTFYNHYNRNSTGYFDFLEFDSDEIEEWIKNEPELVKSIAKIVDSKIVDISIDESKEYEKKVLFTNDKGINLYYRMLSDGTQKMLQLCQKTSYIIRNNGILIIDEIENGVHTELLNALLLMFLNKNNLNSQLIFTTHYPEIFEMKRLDQTKIFKQDQVVFLGRRNGFMTADRLSEIKHDGKKLRNDISIAKAYRDKIVSIHPDKEEIEKLLFFIEK